MPVLIVIAKTISILLSLVSTAMFLRAIVSFVPAWQETRFNALLITITEPVILPVRFLMQKFNIAQNLPIDLSFTITYFLLIFIEMLLPVI